MNVSYDTNASNSAYEYYYGTSNGSYPNSTTASMSGLTPNTTYYIRARAKDNWGRWSGYVYTSFTTTGNAPSITAHKCNIPRQTGADMTYTATYDTNDSLSSYKWELGTSSGTYTAKTVTNSNTVTGLNTNTTYYYKLTVTSAKGRSATATGSFKTDYPTQQVTSIVVDEVGETSIKVIVNVPNPSWLTNLTCWLYESDDSTIKYTQSKSTVTAANEFLFEDLDPGTLYYVKARITTKAQHASIGGYNSNVMSQEVETIDASPVNIVRSDGTIEKHKMYVMGRGNIYNPNRLAWTNGYYATGVVGNAIKTLLTQSDSSTGGAAASTTFIEILPSVPYTITNETEDVNFILHGTDTSDKVTTVGYTLRPGMSYEYKGTSTTKRLYISATTETAALNYIAIKYYRLNIFRTIEKTNIPKENIVYINGKIRYIDIIQAGNTTDNNSHIAKLEVYTDRNELISTGATPTMIYGKNPVGLEYITSKDAFIASKYATVNPKTSSNLETIVRVDLGKDYENVSYVKLWRIPGRTYHMTRLLGRDSTGKLTWKFQSYKMGGEYVETDAGYIGRTSYEEIVGVPLILSVSIIPDNSVNTIVGTNIVINADWAITIPPVLDSYVSYRIDAILSANQGRLLKQEIGSLEELTTEVKSSLVEAINELWTNFNGVTGYSNVLNALLNATLNM